MTKPSELREALSELKYHLSPYSSVTIVEKQSPQVVNAILDAVIASLPEDENGSDTNLYVNGYNWALGQVRSILLSAKSKGGE